MSDYKRWPIWCAHALEHVRFRPDRKGIEKELTAHYEDHCRDLERIGYEPDLAAERALQAMGDADEVGAALDKAHKPWLGWLWEASRVLTAGLLLLLAVALLQNFTLREMAERTVDQFTWQAPPSTADSAVTEYAVLSLTPGEITETEDGSYEVRLNLWIEAEDPRSNFFQILHYLNTADNQGTIPLGRGDGDGSWPDNYLNPGFFRVSYGWTRRQMILLLHLDHRPEWVEIRYPYGGNDWVLRAEWEAAE